MENILKDLGLYQTDRNPYEKVIKQIGTDYTILIKRKNSNWEWYNKGVFDISISDNELKEKLINLLNPQKGKVEIDNWINIKQDTPKEHDGDYWHHTVIAFFIMPNGTKYTETVQWTSNNRFVWNGMNVTEYVTHWMERPKPPQY